MLARQRETVIGAVTFVQLPLTFLSVALMQRNLLPGWIRTSAKFNPVNWAVEAARAAAMQRTDWGLVAGRIGLLLGLLLVSALFCLAGVREVPAVTLNVAAHGARLNRFRTAPGLSRYQQRPKGR